MIKPTVLVIGASRGIGLGLVSKYVVEVREIVITFPDQIFCSYVNSLGVGRSWHNT